MDSSPFSVRLTVPRAPTISPMSHRSTMRLNVPGFFASTRLTSRYSCRAIPYKRLSGWSSKASGGVERHRGRRLKARGGRRETTAKNAPVRELDHHRAHVVKREAKRPEFLRVGVVERPDAPRERVQPRAVVREAHHPSPQRRLDLVQRDGAAHERLSQ
eukprot:31483-Pelagococcus_subviridis.AAC.11